MIFEQKDPPREFEVGVDTKSRIRDCGSILLGADEQVTFLTAAGGEYDVARKSWGFYATPSLNGRLAHFNLRAVLVRSRNERYFLLVVERGREEAFEAYIGSEGLSIVTWMDTTESLSAIARGIAAIA